MKKPETYHKTQASALQTVEENVRERGYEIKYPDYIWPEHVNYGSTVSYTFPLTVIKTGGEAKKLVHVQIYRMDSGNYELNFYIA